jgi:PKD repeat protein
MDKGYAEDVVQAKVLINRSVNDFSITPGTLILSSDGNNTVQFNDSNTNSVKWNWNFGNGYGSTIRNPKVKFFASGTYTIKLVTENSSGCKNTIYKQFVVKQQSPDPVVSNLQICQGTIPKIEAQNSSYIKVYTSPDAPYPAYEGSTFEPLGISFDTTFYVSNAEFDVESSRIPVNIIVSPNKALFILKPSNIDPNNKNLFIAENLSTNSLKNKWYVNGEFKGDNINLLIDVTSYQEVNIKLMSWNPEDCLDELSVNIIKRKSDTPIIGNAISCNGKQAVIKPSNGRSFYFYEDEGLTKLLYKGESFNTVTHERIFITGVDNFIESDPVEVLVNYQDFYPDFSLQPEILNLSYSQQVSFIDLSEGNLKWSWDFGNGESQHVKNPVQFYNEPGEYTVTLLVENQNGCTESVTKTLLVVNINGVEDLSDLAPILEVYPNPAQNSLFLSLQHFNNQRINIKISDQLNRPVYLRAIQYESQPLEVDISTLSTGLYHLQIETPDKLFYKKIIIRK